MLSLPMSCDCKIEDDGNNRKCHAADDRPSLKLFFKSPSLCLTVVRIGSSTRYGAKALIVTFLNEEENDDADRTDYIDYR